MRSGAVIVGEVGFQDTEQVALAENDDVVEAFQTDRADETLGIGILPGGLGRGEHFLDAHALHSIAECLAVDTVAVANHVLGRRVLRESFDDLLGSPAGTGTELLAEGEILKGELFNHAVRSHRRSARPELVL